MIHFVAYFIEDSNFFFIKCCIFAAVEYSQIFFFELNTKLLIVCMEEVYIKNQTC